MGVTLIKAILTLFSPPLVDTPPGVSDVWYPFTEGGIMRSAEMGKAEILRGNQEDEKIIPSL